MRQGECEEIGGLLSWLFGETYIEDSRCLGVYARSGIVELHPRRNNVKILD